MTGKIRIPVNPKAFIPTYIEISESNGERPMFAPTILGSAICLKSVMTPYITIRPMPLFMSSVRKHIADHGIKIVPVPNIGNKSTIQINRLSSSAYLILMTEKPQKSCINVINVSKK